MNLNQTHFIMKLYHYIFGITSPFLWLLSLLVSSVSFVELLASLQYVFNRNGISIKGLLLLLLHTRATEQERSHCRHRQQTDNGHS